MIKIFEDYISRDTGEFKVDFNCYKKYKKGDIVYVIGNNDPAEIIDTNYDAPYEHYLCKYPNRQYWYSEMYIIRKLEDFEINALKYNL